MLLKILKWLATGVFAVVTGKTKVGDKPITSSGSAWGALLGGLATIALLLSYFLQEGKPIEWDKMIAAILIVIGAIRYLVGMRDATGPRPVAPTG